MDRDLDQGGCNLAVPLYTIVPWELVLTGVHTPLELKERCLRDGSRLLVRSDGRLERLVSTNPQHYLSPHMRPGAHGP